MEEIKTAINKVYSSLGYGYKEHIYSNAMIIELRNLNYQFHNEVVCPILYENIQVGYERADIVIYKPINCVLEFKAQTMSLQKKDIIQLNKYLINLNIQHGVLINFGSSLEIMEIEKDIEITNNKTIVID